MTDSFEDLWSSSAPIPQKQKPQTLASASASGRPPLSTISSSKSDVFALLAGSNTGGSTQQRYGSSSSLGGAANSNARSTTPASRPMSALGGASIHSVGGRSTSSTPAPLVTKPSTTSHKGGNDAFSDLFSSSSGSGSNGHANMTLASRLAMEARQKSQGAGSARQGPGTQSDGLDAWAGLDALGGGGGLKPTPVASTRKNVDDNDDWGLGDFGSSTTSSTTQPTSKIQPQSRPTAPASKPSTSSGKSLWDIDDFAAPTRPTASSSSKPRKTVDEHFDTPDDDFDFGAREDEPPHGYSQTHARHQRTGLLDLDDDDLDPEDAPDTATGLLGHVDHEHEDDFLGVLAKPVGDVKKYHSSSAVVSQSVSPAPTSVSPQISGSSGPPRRQTGSSNSPPPHILGQIVEMGFSVGQAREALAKTSNGRDVQAALEMLLNGGNGASTSQQPTDVRGSEPPRRNAPKGFKERERERMERNRREREREESGGTVTDVQEQADRLLSQATEIGQSVWSKASAFWKEGKEKVAKAYEERAAPASLTDGRPKWMQDSSPDELRGGDEPERIPPRPRPKPQAERFIDDDLQTPAPPVPEVDLFGTLPSQPQPPSSIPRQRSQGPSRPRTQFTPAVASPPRPITRDRPLPSISSSVLSSAFQYKTAGTEQFKLGQYGPAIESYTSAINALPDGHLLLVPLFTNRSLARMRNGEYKGAVDDAGGALSVVLVVGGQGSTNGVHEFDPSDSGRSGPQITATSWSPSIEPAQVVSASQQKLHNGGWQHPQGLGVDLVDCFVKALRRRAEGLEGREKWSDALKDWEVLSALGWVQESIRMEAQRGGARCRKMVDNGSRISADNSALPGIQATSRNSSTAARPSKPPPPKPKSKPASTSVEPSAALLSLQATNAQAEADDTLKHQLKDSIDSKLSTWRTGKESNIRALLASLDLVLWEEILKGAKVGGLHELITPIQVKKAYMKAIGRVHPDKLNAQNSTVEQRMLANGVFGTLNEAWIAFQNA